MIVSALIAAIIGGALYRVRGMGLWPSRPWWHLAFALPYGIVAYSYSSIYIGVVVFLLAFGAVVTGHASYIDLGTVEDGASNIPADGKQEEWYGAWLPWHGYWHDFAGLAVSGMLLTVPCGAVMLAYGHWSGAFVLVSGALKPVAYACGWRMWHEYSVSAIAVGETLAGALLWGSLALIVSA